MVGNEQNRPFGGHLVDAIALNPEVLFVKVAGERKTDFHHLIVVPPGVITEAANRLADTGNLRIQRGRDQFCFQVGT